MKWRWRLTAIWQVLHDDDCFTFAGVAKTIHLMLMVPLEGLPSRYQKGKRAGPFTD
jgi:hypothetical protein